MTNSREVFVGLIVTGVGLTILLMTIGVLGHSINLNFYCVIQLLCVVMISLMAAFHSDTQTRSIRVLSGLTTFCCGLLLTVTVLSLCSTGRLDPPFDQPAGRFTQIRHR